jgi:hypothetical protein
MAIRADSYSSTTDVKHVTRHLLDGMTAFNSTTNPTVTAVERFIDYASGQLNLALWGAGFNPSVIRANSTAKVAADGWVTAEAARWVEMTQRGQGYNDQEGSRTGGFKGLRDRADTFARVNTKGFKYMGLTVAHASSEGLTFTGLTAPADRTDPSDTGLAQPKFTRGQFDDRAISRTEDDVE